MLVSHLVTIGLTPREASFVGFTQQADMSATGTIQGTAAPLTGNVIDVTTATVGVNDGILLPLTTDVKRFPYFILNSTAGNIKIYPNVGDNINAAAANAPTTLASGVMITMMPVKTQKWIGG